MAEQAQQKPWSRWAKWLGVVACLSSPLAWFYGLPLALAAVALVLATIAALSGERSRAAWLWPSLAILLGGLVYFAYLRLTDGADSASAEQTLNKNFAESFDQDFANLVGDAGEAAQAPKEGAAPAAW